MMHPLRKEFINHYKEFNKDKEFLKVNEVDQEDQEEIKELSKFLENEKEEIDVSDAQTIFFSFAEAGKKKDLLNAFEFASKQAAKKKQIGNSVKRNKIKRRLRNIVNEGVKKISINYHYSYLVIAKITMLNNEYAIIKETLFQDFKRIK